MGQSASDTLSFYNGPTQLATDMVVGQYYTVVTVAGLNFGTYGTLQSAPLGNGTANTVGAVYLCTSVPASGTATVSPLAIPLTNAVMTNSAFAPLAAYSTGTAGFDTAGHAQALYNQVVAITDALRALGIVRSA